MTSDKLRELWSGAYRLCDKYMDEIHTEKDWSDFAQDIGKYGTQHDFDNDEMCQEFCFFLARLFDAVYRGRYCEAPSEQVSMFDGVV